jgi:hypothetical protein
VTRRLTIQAALLGFFLGLLGPALLLDSAGAVTCGDRQAIEEQSGTNGRGAKGDNPGVRVTNDVVDCEHEVALGVSNTSGTRMVLVGWYQKGESGFPFDCPITSAGNPRVLVTKYFDGTWTCDPDTAGITNTPVYNEFAVHDKDQDGDWRYYRNDNYLGFYGMGTFVTGAVFTHTDRKVGNTMDAYYNQMYRMNSSQNWTLWTDTFEATDTSAQYNGCVTNDVVISVQDVAC